ncbi:FAD binding domain-containing protein [Streptomyces sp. NPDC088387]|uniref:FAD binding domain-containing protein n=1 Tax=Streptomyces sp. NPDC088387 TaxID=3365859 RepID=UPI003827731C
MHPFTFTRARTVDEALAAGARGSRYLAGGTTMVDLMRQTVERPGSVVDINRLPLRGITRTPAGLRIGALARMSETAANPVVRRHLPAITQALELSASAQLRNSASIGGNLMQRTRCPYFRDVTTACNKREPGSGCAALEGYNRTHAILGVSSHCVATHPSDLAVALTALDAVVHLRGRDSERSLGIGEFFLRPGTSPHREHALRPGELITAVDVPLAPHSATSGYLKVRDRESYEFAIASAAVGLHIDGGVILSARVAVGGVATVPWRLPAVERRLVGARPSQRLWEEAAAAASEGAAPLRDNGFKTELLERTVARQLATVGGAK